MVVGQPIWHEYIILIKTIMKNITLFLALFFASFFTFHDINAQITSAPLGTGTSSSATRGPFQRSDTMSSSVHSRAHLVYTQAEVLTTLGISSGSTISQINWDLGSTNVITATGNATLTVYMKNSSLTDAAAGFWTDIINGASVVGTYTFNTTNNFPGVEGFMDFPLDTDFVYTGGTLEVAVEWDCSGLTSIHSNANRLFSGNGSLNWHWDATTHTSLIYRAGSSSPPSELVAGSNLKAQRVNTQFVYTLPASCPAPLNVSASNITTSAADLSWDAASGASAYNWKIVAAGAGSGGTAVASGTTASIMASATALTEFTAYDLYVQTDCGGGSLSDYSTAYNFTTAASSAILDTVTIGTSTSSSASRGPTQIAGGTSTVKYSRFHMVYTAAELATVGITSGSTITELQWNRGNSNIIQGAGDAFFKIYLKNSSATAAASDTWVNIINGATEVLDRTFNTTNNFPASTGYMPFPLGSNFQYTGDALEVMVEWDMSGITSDPANGITAFDGDGSARWRWEATGHVSVAKRTGSGSAPSTISDLLSERANIQILYVPPSSFTCGGTQLVADATMDTYSLITSVLGPAGDPIETPDCGHTSFLATPGGNVGEHIDQAYDSDLAKDVFRFHMHVNEDDDRCINFDRQRNEIKTYAPSPDNLLGVLGETVQYKWKFKLDAGFQSSSKFTHIHQLKSVGASNNEDDMPQITFTCRKGTPDQLELRYAEDLTQITWAQTDLTPFKGEWVEVTETVTYGDYGDGVYSVSIDRISDGMPLLSYTNNSTRMWKTNASFVRPKWGIYRSLEDDFDLRDEIVLFADFCIDELSTLPDCGMPTTFLNATNITSSTGDLVWGGVAGAISYDWKIVAAGAGSGAPAIASGTTSNTTATATGLTSSTSYDLYVDADCGSSNVTGFSAAYNFMTTTETNEVTTDPIGTETSSSSSRGPIHQAGVGASTRYSRFFHVFTEAELAAVGLTENSSITQLQWYITTSDVITGAGDAPWKIYIKNSTATEATEDTWTALTTGATLALDRTFNAANNFPGAAGWMPFVLDAPFVYTGGALEVAVEWNWDNVAFTNDGSIKWRYSNFADDLVSRALGTASYSTNLTYSTTSKQRANMQIVYEPAPPASCDVPSNLSVINITTSSADLSWDAVTDASEYLWKVVESGAGSDGMAVASGTTTNTSVVAIGLTCLTAYDFYVQAECMAGDTTAFSDVSSFVTSPAEMPSTLTLGTSTSSSSSRGPLQQGGGNTSTRYSRFNQVFTQTELAAAGLSTNSSITELQWYITTTDIIAGVGDAPFKVYIKNSSVTEATTIGWADLTLDMTQVVDRVFNTTNNFPGAAGWMSFPLDVPFTYTGDGLEIAVEWDYGSVSSPAFTGSDASNPNGGSIKWRYSSTPDTTVVRALGSGSHSTSNLTFSTGSTLPTQRANIQMLYVPASGCIEECSEMLQLDQMDISNDTYRANTIASKGIVENGSTVVFAANTSVTLQEDFHAKAGATFVAKIEACTPPPSANETSDEYSESALIDTRSANVGLDVKVYPNPISQELTIELQEFEQGQVRLLDATGKVHFARIITGSTTLQTHHLPIGIYFLQVFDEVSGQSFTRRIVKQE